MNRFSVVAVALLAGVTLSITAFAADPVPTSLETPAAQEYVGTWDLAMEFQGNPVAMQLTVVDLDGKIGATIDNEQMPEATAISEAAIDENGITFTYDMDFGGNAFTLDIKGKLEGDTFVGVLAEQSGLFSADFTGTKGTAAAPLPSPTELNTTDAADYLGFWNLAMEIQGNPVEVELNIVDVNGKIGATVNNEIAPAPAEIAEATADESGITLTYDMDFGGNAFTINIIGRVIDGKLEGTFGEKSGLFTADFVGEKGEARLARGGSEGGEGEGRRRGRRGGGTSAKISIDGKDISITFADLKMSGEDFEKLAGLKEGSQFAFVGGRATKLRTDHSLKFGDVVVKKENAAPNYPGVYSMWLKRVSGDTWHLVFNEDADIWGTQHDPARDAAEVPLTMSKLDEPSETFKVELEEDGNGGVLKIQFGSMAWSAKFETVD